MDTLIVQTAQRPTIYAGPDLAPPYRVDGRRLTLGDAPWPSQPDILCTHDVFCGLTYHVAPEFLDAVQRWVTQVGSDRVRLVNVSAPNNYYGYGDHFSTEYYLEVLWTPGEPDRIIFAELSEDGWLYREERQGHDPFDAVYGVMLVAVADIATECGLKLPERFV